MNYNPNVNITNFLSVRVYNLFRAPGLGGQAAPVDPGDGGVAAYTFLTPAGAIVPAGGQAFGASMDDGEKTEEPKQPEYKPPEPHEEEGVEIGHKPPKEEKKEEDQSSEHENP